jgi:hypothetical protein
MAFDWKEFLELARILGRDAEGSGHREAFLRSALGRAYYAAFCHARNYARDYLGFRPRYDGDDHGALREKLKRGKRRGVSDRLEQLRKWRNDCDYKEEVDFDLQKSLHSGLA